MNARSSFARNVVSNWAVLSGHLAYGLLMTPIIVGALGSELYGVWSFLSGLVTYTELLYFGLGSALIKDVARLRDGDDRRGLSRLMSVVTTIYSGLGLFCLLTAFLLSGVVSDLFANPLSPEAARAASIGCLLLGARVATVFVSSAFSGLLAGFDRFDVSNSVQLGSLALRVIATPLVLTAGPNPLVMIAALGAAVGAIEAVTLAVLANRFVTRLRIAPARPTSAELATLYGFGVQSFLILLAVKITGYTDTTVIGLTLGATSVAMFALPLQLVEFTKMAVAGFSGVLLPRLSILAKHGAHEELGLLLTRVSRLGLFLSAWMVSTVIAVGPAFLALWVGPQFRSPARWILIWLGLASWVHVVISMVPLAFYQALHLLRRPALVFCIEALLNLALSVYLAPRYGIAGVAFGTALPTLVSFTMLPPFLCGQLGLSFRVFISSMIPGTVLLIGNVLWQIMLAGVLGDHSLLALVARALSSVPIAVGVFVWLFPAAEQREVIGVVTRVFRARTHDHARPPAS